MGWLKKFKDDYNETMAAQKANQDAKDQEKLKRKQEQRAKLKAAWEKNPLGVILNYAFIALVIGGFLYWIAPASQQEKQAKEAARRAEECKSESSARYWAEYYIKNNLKSPKSAEFPGKAVAKPLGNCRYEVFGQVDAQNSYGATIRTAYSVTMTFDMSSGSWIAAGIDIH